MSDTSARTDRVLVVDDDDEVLQIVRVSLEQAGFEIIVAKNGEEALQRAATEPPDMIVLDVMMPRLDGIEVCKRLRADYETKAIGVILLSAKSSSTDKLIGFRAGADDYVTKPFDPEELVERVRTALRRNREMTSMSPLTGLPGNLEIEDKLIEVITSGQQFALLHVDIDDFKAYNDYYGLLRGDQAIKLLARCIRRVIGEVEPQWVFLGHVGGDDFAVIVDPGSASLIAQLTIDHWDRWVPQLYEPRDRENGYIEVLDRRKRIQRFTKMTLSIGIATNMFRDIDTHLQAADIAAEVKQIAKRDPKSSFVVDRRQNDDETGTRPDPRTVLIVDDDADTREILRLHCEFLGFNVIGEAGDGKQAIALGAEHLPAFAILDQRMPVLQGKEAAEELRRLVPGINVIAFSAILDEKPEWADEFLSKYDVAELTPFLGKILGAEPPVASPNP